mgnify:CR=1 FL=1
MKSVAHSLHWLVGKPEEPGKVLLVVGKFVTSEKKDRFAQAGAELLQ